MTLETAMELRALLAEASAESMSKYANTLEQEIIPRWQERVAELEAELLQAKRETLVWTLCAVQRMKLAGNVRIAILAWMTLVKHHALDCAISMGCLEGVKCANDANRWADTVLGTSEEDEDARCRWMVSLSPGKAGREL